MSGSKQNLAAYQAELLVFYGTDGTPLTPLKLLEMAERAELEHEELAKQFPPGTVHDRRNNLYEVSKAALLCATWMDKQGAAELVFVGQFGPVMPHRGQKVVIRKGAVIFTTRTGKGVPSGGVVSVRDQTVTVFSADRGYVDWSGTSRAGPECLRQARVTWIGAGGYYRWTDANNVRINNQLLTSAAGPETQAAGLQEA